MISSRSVSLAALTSAALLLGACSAPDKSTPLPLGAGGSAGGDGPKLPLAVAGALDSGNTAMRAKDYGSAVTQYRLAVSGAPDHAAPWFGLYMAAKELQNTALADSAMQQVRRITADSSVLPAHKEVADAAMPAHAGPTLPQGHPKTAKDGGPLPGTPPTPRP